MFMFIRYMSVYTVLTKYNDRNELRRETMINGSHRIKYILTRKIRTSHGREQSLVIQPMFDPCFKYIWLLLEIRKCNRFSEAFASFKIALGLGLVTRK